MLDFEGGSEERKVVDCLSKICHDTPRAHETTTFDSRIDPSSIVWSWTFWILREPSFNNSVPAHTFPSFMQIFGYKKTIFNHSKSNAGMINLEDLASFSTNVSKSNTSFSKITSLPPSNILLSLLTMLNDVQTLSWLSSHSCQTFTFFSLLFFSTIDSVEMSIRVPFRRERNIDRSSDSCSKENAIPDPATWD